MQDNRWCEMCGSDRGTKNVRWYDWYGTEMSFCGKCITEVRAQDIGPFVLIAE